MSKPRTTFTIANLSFISIAFFILHLFPHSIASPIRIKFSKSPLENTIDQFEFLAAINESPTNASINLIQKHIHSYLNIQYFITLEFGESLEVFRVLIDTGSSWLWIPSSEFSGKKFSHKYSCETNSGCGIIDNVPKVLNYGRGRVLGFLAEDRICFQDSKHCVENQNFVLVTDQIDLNGIQADGIIGLSPREFYDDYPMLLKNLKQQGVIEEMVFSISLDEVNGELILGGIDKEFVENRKLIYEDLVSQTHWTVNLQKVALVKKTGKVRKAYSRDFKAMIDSGTSCIHMPSDIYDEFIEDLFRIAGVQAKESFRRLRYFQCSDNVAKKFPTLELVFGETVFRIKPEDYIFEQHSDTCLAMFQPADFVDLWVLGDVFLRKVYTVFDMERGRVGFVTQEPNESMIFVAAKDLFMSPVFLLLMGLLCILVYFRRLKEKIVMKFKKSPGENEIGMTSIVAEGYAKDVI